MATPRMRPASAPSSLRYAPANSRPETPSRPPSGHAAFSSSEREPDSERQPAGGQANDDDHPGNPRPAPSAQTLPAQKPVEVVTSRDLALQDARRHESPLLSRAYAEWSTTVELDNAMRLARAPLLVAPMPTAQMGHADATHAVIGASQLKVVGSPADGTLTAFADRHTVALSAAVAAPGGGELALTAANAGSFVSATASYATEHGTTIGFLGGATSQGYLPGVGFNFAQQVGAGVGVGGSLFGLADANYRSRLTGSDGDLVELTSQATKYLGGQATLSLGSHGVGLGLRSYGFSSQAQELTEMVPVGTAKRAIADNGLVKDKLLGLMPSKRAADLSVSEQPQRLKQGQQVKSRRSSGNAKSVVVGGFGVFAGAHRLQSQESSISIQRDSAAPENLVVNIETATSKSTSLSVDLPLLGTANQSSKTSEADQLNLTISPDQLAAEGVLTRQKKNFGLTEHYQLPQQTSIENIKNASTMIAAIGEFRSLQQKADYVGSFTHQKESIGRARRVAALPLLRFFHSKLKWGLAYERQTDIDTESYSVEATRGSRMWGRKMVVRREMLHLGADERSAGYYFVARTTAEFGSPDATQSSPQLDSAHFRYNLLVIQKKVQSDNLHGFDKVQDWVQSLVRSSDVNEKRPKKTVKLPTYMIEASLGMEITALDKRKLLAAGFFSGLTAPSVEDDAALPAALVEQIDEALAEMVTSSNPEPRLTKLMQVLGKKMEVTVTTNLPRRLDTWAAKLAIKRDDFLPQKIEEASPEELKPLSGKLERANKAIERADAAKSAADHGLFQLADHSPELQSVTKAASKIEKVALATAGVEKREELSALEHKLSRKRRQSIERAALGSIAARVRPLTPMQRATTKHVRPEVGSLASFPDSRRLR